MSKKLITFNTAVPTYPLPGSPVVHIFDNGDWEMGLAGDVNYVAEWASNYFVSVPFSEFFVELMIFFDIGDVDDLDVVGDITNLFISETVATDTDGEPVLLIWEDREFEVMERHDAEQLCAADAMNFIPVADLVEEFCSFRGKRGDAIFDVQENEPLDADEDAEPEEGL